MLPLSSKDRKPERLLKSSDGGASRPDGWKVEGSKQPFSVETQQGCELLQSFKPKPGCAGSIPAAPLPSEAIKAENARQRAILQSPDTQAAMTAWREATYAGVRVVPARKRDEADFDQRVDDLQENGR